MNADKNLICIHLRSSAVNSSGMTLHRVNKPDDNPVPRGYNVIHAAAARDA